MTTTNLTRRTAMFGTVTLPAALAPAVAVANSSMSTSTPSLLAGGEPVFATDANNDPFVSAFCRYVDAEAAYNRHCNATASLPVEEHEKAAAVLGAEASDAMLEMAETVPTSTLGLYMAICALLPAFGELRRTDGNPFSFDDMHVAEKWTNGSGEALLRSLKEAAERILNNNHPEDV